MNDLRVERLAEALSEQAEIEVDDEVRQQCEGLIAMFESAGLVVSVMDFGDPA